MHSDMLAEPAKGYPFAETRKYLRYAAVSDCALEPPGIRHDPQAVRDGDAAMILDLVSIAATIVACPHRLSHSPSGGAGEDDYLDFYRAPPPRKKAARVAKPSWQPKVVDDWPDEVPPGKRSRAGEDRVRPGRLSQDDGMTGGS